MAFPFNMCNLIVAIPHVAHQHVLNNMHPGDSFTSKSRKLPIIHKNRRFLHVDRSTVLAHAVNISAILLLCTPSPTV